MVWQKKPLLISCLLAAVAAGAAGEIELREGTTVRLAASQEAARILGEEDAFIASMSPFDRSARVETDREVSKEEFLEFAARQARDFSEAESGKLEMIFSSIRKKFGVLELKPNLPATITVVKTTGREEGRAAYCRGTAIVLPSITGGSIHLTRESAHYA